VARFPKSEAEIMALAQTMGPGLAVNDAIYPNPPITLVAFGVLISAYSTARNDAVAAQAAAELAIAAKDEALEALISAMKAEIRYAENTVNYNDEKLKLIGWGGRAARTSLEIPSQARTLEAPREGEGWIHLDWKEAVDGGAVAAYKIQRRLRPDGAWLDIGMSVESEITLTDQERGKEWEYRVLAVNKTGVSEASNTVMAVL
jgi:hypothetical protein